jgi:hypothetical protein
VSLAGGAEATYSAALHDIRRARESSVPALRFGDGGPGLDIDTDCAKKRVFLRAAPLSSDGGGGLDGSHCIRRASDVSSSAIHEVSLMS